MFKPESSGGNESLNKHCSASNKATSCHLNHIAGSLALAAALVPAPGDRRGDDSRRHHCVYRPSPLGDRADCRVTRRFKGILRQLGNYAAAECPVTSRG